MEENNSSKQEIEMMFMLIDNKMTITENKMDNSSRKIAKLQQENY